jgi:MGT family glycosyltransferase
MMDYLVTIWDAGGSVPPELAVVRKLVARGHRVVVLAGPPLQGAVEANGATFRSWQRVPHRHDATEPDPFSDSSLPGPPKVVQLLLDRVIAGPARDYAAEVGAALDEHRSDALISSMLMLGGMAAAEARGVPFVAMLPNCYLLPCPGMPPFGTGWFPARGRTGRLRDAAINRLATRLWDRGVPTFNTARAELGLAPLAHVFDQHDTAARVLVLTSRAFDFPAELPPNVRYVGPQLDDPDWTEPAELPPGDEPLVLVGMSSTFMDQADLLRRVVAALDQLPVRGLVTTGPEIEPSAVPGAARIRVVRSAPHAAVLPHAAAVVSHGGHGTVTKALAAGVPQLALPLGRDQPNNAARVVAAGAGLRLKSTAKPRAIAAAMRRLLDEQSFRTRAAQLAAVLRADTATSAAIDELEGVTRRADGMVRD